MQTNIRVIILKGQVADVATSFQFEQAFKIGRDATCPIYLSNSLVSRNHAEVIKEGENWVLQDLGSTNGIWVNGARVTHIVLDGAKEVEFGRNGPLLRFEPQTNVVEKPPEGNVTPNLATSFWQSLGDISGGSPAFSEPVESRIDPKPIEPTGALASGFFASFSDEAEKTGESAFPESKPLIDSGVFKAELDSGKAFFESKPENIAFEAPQTPLLEEPAVNEFPSTGLASGFFHSLSESVQEEASSPPSPVSPETSTSTGLASGFFRSLSESVQEEASSSPSPPLPETTPAPSIESSLGLGTGFFAGLTEEAPNEVAIPPSPSAASSLPSSIFKALADIPQQENSPSPTPSKPEPVEDPLKNLGLSSGISSALKDLQGITPAQTPDLPQTGLNTGFFRSLENVVGEAPSAAPVSPTEWEVPSSGGWDIPNIAQQTTPTSWESSETPKPDWLTSQTDWDQKGGSDNVPPNYEWSTPGMPAVPEQKTTPPEDDPFVNWDAPQSGGLTWDTPPPVSGGMSWGSPPAEESPSSGWESEKPAASPAFDWAAKPSEPQSAASEWGASPPQPTQKPASADVWSAPENWSSPSIPPTNQPPSDWGSEKKWEPSAIAPSYQDAPKTSPAAGSVSGYMRKFESGQTAEMGSRTQMMMAAFNRMSKRDKQKYYVIIGVVAVGLLIAAIWAFWKHSESNTLGAALDASNNALTTQDSLNVVLFYQIKELQLKFANDSTLNTNKKLRDETARKIIEMQQAYSEKMRARPQYRAAVNLANGGNNIGSVDKLIFDITRLFGENEMIMPAGYVEKVKQYIKYWQSSSRYINALKTAQENGYVEPIVASFMKRGVPPQFFYLGMQESNFNTKIVGPPTRYGHAKGMWQFIPATGAKYGLRIGPLKDSGVYDPGDERHDPVKAGEAASSYIADIYKTDAQASGLCVMASYNWGEGNVIKRIRAMPNNPRDRNFWNMYTQTWMPEETKNYVFYITAAAVIGENPRLFGFDFDNPLAAAIQRVGSGQYVMPGGGPSYSDLPPMTLAMDSEREQLFKFRTFW